MAIHHQSAARTETRPMRRCMPMVASALEPISHAGCLLAFDALRVRRTLSGLPRIRMREGFEVTVDRTHVLRLHLLIIRPGHHLQ
jgi:hypothetical protein